ncbi:uncharacterized protein CBL_08260 [Carabus blaptoides fortunei]
MPHWARTATDRPFRSLLPASFPLSVMERTAGLKTECGHFHRPAMTGDILSFAAHKDIYYLETKTKSQTSEDLVNLFASPAGRELVKYKPKAKTKYKANPAAAIDFFAFKTPGDPTTPEPKPGGDSPGKGTTPGRPQTRRKSLELYNEAATILGLTCSQTNDCKCIECQCHYFDDFEEDLDYASTDSYTDHQSLCSIQ